MSVSAPLSVNLTNSGFPPNNISNPRPNPEYSPSSSTGILARPFKNLRMPYIKDKIIRKIDLSINRFEKCKEKLAPTEDTISKIDEWMSLLNSWKYIFNNSNGDFEYFNNLERLFKNTYTQQIPYILKEITCADDTDIGFYKQYGARRRHRTRKIKH